MAFLVGDREAVVVVGQVPGKRLGEALRLGGEPVVASRRRQRGQAGGKDSEDDDGEGPLGSHPRDPNRTLLTGSPYGSWRWTTRCFRAVAVDGADDGLERRGEDALVEADAPADLAVGPLGLDVGDGGGVGAGADRVLGVVDHLDVDAEVGLQGGTKAAIGPLPSPYRAVLAVDEQLRGDRGALVARWSSRG